MENIKIYCENVKKLVDRTAGGVHFNCEKIKIGIVDKICSQIIHKLSTIKIFKKHKSEEVQIKRLENLGEEKKIKNFNCCNK